MKELTIEEKAKRYGEALERAKKLQETCDSMAVVGWCEYIFPELNESEGDKIRKVLLDYFQSYKEVGTVGAETFNGIPTDNILTWLEKQGEKFTAIDVDKMVMEYSHTKDGDFGLPVNCMTRAYRKGINDALKVKQGHMLDANKVIKWLNDQACLGWIEDVQVDKFITKFKKDFKL